MIARRTNRQNNSGFLAGVVQPTVAGLLGSFCIFRCLYPNPRGHDPLPPPGDLPAAEDKTRARALAPSKPRRRSTRRSGKRTRRAAPRTS